MSTVTDAEVEALEAVLDEPMSLYASKRHKLRAALEAAEAVRVKAESNLQKVQIPTSTIPEGFIPWHGGECPVQGGRVSAVFRRGGAPTNKFNSGAFRWSHEGNRPDDIIAYRIHKPADFRLEAGKFYVTASGERVGPMRHNFGAYGSAYRVSGDWGRWWWPNGEIGLLGSGDPDILALSSNQESGT
jgi:hypothetical protein